MSPHVPGDLTPPHPSAELDALRRACLRIQTGDPGDLSEIERILEGGFGAMIGLEADLSRLRREGALRDELDAERICDLHTSITELSDALTELRTLAVSPEEPRIGFGFVLPERRQRRISGSSGR
jgi:hypothetical protein